MRITIVRAPGCHFCEDAEEVVAALAAQYPIDVSLVEIHSPQGRELVARHRPAMNPLVVLEGEFFSAGRLPRGKLRRTLERAAAGRPVEAEPSPAVDRPARVG